jgi:hypothetical protein
MDWPGHIAADVVRAHWVRARWQFSPLAGWPPPWPGEVPMELSSRPVDLAAIAAALSVVSSRSQLWEAQALIVDYCSSRAEDPAPQWTALAGLDPSGEGWRSREGIAGFIADVQPATPSASLPLHPYPYPVPYPYRYPYWALVSAGQIMSRAFRSATLDGLGYLVARLDDWDECRVYCENSPNPHCMQECLSERLC